MHVHDFETLYVVQYRMVFSGTYDVEYLLELDTIYIYIYIYIISC